MFASYLWPHGSTKYLFLKNIYIHTQIWITFLYHWKKPRFSTPNFQFCNWLQRYIRQYCLPKLNSPMLMYNVSSIKISEFVGILTNKTFPWEKYFKIQFLNLRSIKWQRKLRTCVISILSPFQVLFFLGVWTPCIPLKTFMYSIAD